MTSLRLGTADQARAEPILPGG